MEDVIFAGSESRGPAGLAEVSLTFDAQAMPGTAAAGRRALGPGRAREVVVTRRLHRDGTSEYLLGGVPCRLRDIVDFFLGTGVGTKAYSIIEQGRIGFIVSSRPEDRRGLIDEAAGITKYKAKKKLAERRMEGDQAAPAAGLGHHRRARQPAALAAHPGAEGRALQALQGRAQGPRAVERLAALPRAAGRGEVAGRRGRRAGRGARPAPRRRCCARRPRSRPSAWPSPRSWTSWRRPRRSCSPSATRPTWAPSGRALRRRGPHAGRSAPASAIEIEELGRAAPRRPPWSSTCCRPAGWPRQRGREQRAGLPRSCDAQHDELRGRLVETRAPAGPAQRRGGAAPHAVARLETEIEAAAAKRDDLSRRAEGMAPSRTPRAEPSRCAATSRGGAAPGPGAPRRLQERGELEGRREDAEARVGGPQAGAGARRSRARHPARGGPPAALAPAIAVARSQTRYESFQRGVRAIMKQYRAAGRRCGDEPTGQPADRPGDGGRGSGRRRPPLGLGRRRPRAGGGHRAAAARAGDRGRGGAGRSAGQHHRRVPRRRGGRHRVPQAPQRGAFELHPPHPAHPVPAGHRGLRRQRGGDRDSATVTQVDQRSRCDMPGGCAGRCWSSSATTGSTTGWRPTCWATCWSARISRGRWRCGARPAPTRPSSPWTARSSIPAGWSPAARASRAVAGILSQKREIRELEEVVARIDADLEPARARQVASKQQLADAASRAGGDRRRAPPGRDGAWSASRRTSTAPGARASSWTGAATQLGAERRELEARASAGPRSGSARPARRWTTSGALAIDAETLGGELRARDRWP